MSFICTLISDGPWTGCMGINVCFCRTSKELNPLDDEIVIKMKAIIDTDIIVTGSVTDLFIIWPTQWFLGDFSYFLPGVWTVESGVGVGVPRVWVLAWSQICNLPCEGHFNSWHVQLLDCTLSLVLRGFSRCTVRAGCATSSVYCYHRPYPFYLDLCAILLQYGFCAI